MLCLQYLNHLGSAMLTPYGNLRLMEPLVHHHRLLNYYQPRFGWKYMPYPTELQVSPIHYICAMTSKCCHLRVYYIDDARCRTATHVIHMSHHGVYAEMQQRGPLRYQAKVTLPNHGITLSRTSHLDKIGVEIHKATVLRVLASQTSSDQSNTQGHGCAFTAQW
jgi:hypothetical protein